ncbi:basic amino acid/polyamine antiporter [Aquabacter spiritensis]|uniref:Arginine:ornithine antiporter (APA family) n=1 Tax=Aquabacter spiritensis TaxID=933073 RepID=A0A4R3LVU0_9HYPH|nr:basic amino acid/polyamine antiporter [Aquabacter spiritensis]TCT04770.1 arginine:ornithine antiporter (APA family) [Aquabacter spiritensis]
MTTSPGAPPGAPTGTPDASAPAGGARAGTLSLAALSCLVVGSMVGGGIFSLPQAFGEATGILGALIAWAIAGTGMLMLVFVFQTLAQRRPDIDAGIYAYALVGFGAYAGFIAALSYWASAFLGNVAFLVLVMSTLGAFLPAFGAGDTVPALIGASALLWGFHVMLLRGVKEAAAINTIVTLAKLLPLALFLVIVLVALRGDLMAQNFLGGERVAPQDILEQVRRTMLIVVFVFLGIEGASVYSRLARRREDVGRATVIGFLGVLALFVLVTVLSYGILPRAELAALHDPSVAGVLAAIIGETGRVFISLGVLISVLGAFLAWSLLAAEVLSAAARHGVMPAFLGRMNAAGAPSAAIWLTTVTAQFFLLLTLFAESAFRFFVELTSVTALIPYLFVAAYGLKLAWTGETYRDERREKRRDLLVGVLATISAAGMIYAGGIKMLLLSCIIFAPGTVLFVAMGRGRRLGLFSVAEAAAAAAILLCALVAGWALAVGAITL